MVAGGSALQRHGSYIPLAREPGSGTRTVEGPIHGDPPWPQAENYSYRWSNTDSADDVVNTHLRNNWERIRNDLAFDGRHKSSFDAGRNVGEGYFNRGMHGAGARESVPHIARHVRVHLELSPGSPPSVFVVTAYPAAGLG